MEPGGEVGDGALYQTTGGTVVRRYIAPFSTREGIVYYTVEDRNWAGVLEYTALYILLKGIKHHGSRPPR